MGLLGCDKDNKKRTRRHPARPGRRACDGSTPGGWVSGFVFIGQDKSPKSDEITLSLTPHATQRGMACACVGVRMYVA